MFALSGSASSRLILIMPRGFGPASVKWWRARMGNNPYCWSRWRRSDIAWNLGKASDFTPKLIHFRVENERVHCIRRDQNTIPCRPHNSPLRSGKLQVGKYRQTRRQELSTSAHFPFPCRPPMHTPVPKPNSPIQELTHVCTPHIYVPAAISRCRNMIDSPDITRVGYRCCG